MNKVIKIPKVSNGEYKCYLDDDSNFDQLLDLIKSKNVNKKKFIIIDSNIKKLYPSLCEEINEIENTFCYFFKAYEENKSVHELKKIVDFVMDRIPSKNDIMYLIGGGITLNIGGFAASIILRGIPFVHVPTTLLAQIDVLSGGKQAVNYRSFKNQIGLYNDPKYAYCNISFLDTLSEDDYRAQLVEGYKLLLCYDKEAFFRYVDKDKKYFVRDDKTKTFALVEKFIEMKNDLISKDVFEQNYGVGMVYGHTLGHAIETSSRGKLSHGEAVAIGMLLASEISVKLNIAEENLIREHEKVIEILKIDLNKIKDLSLEDVLEHLDHDKKRYNNEVGFVLLDKIGNISINNEKYFYPIEEKLVKEVVNKYIV